jgi:hypothetical protein
MLPENEDEIRTLLGNGDRFSQAEHYYDTGGVRAIGVADETEIVARVSPGANKVLSLRIHAENGGFSSSCECNQEAPCEHVGAVLLTVLREEIPVKPGTRWGGHISGLQEYRQRPSSEAGRTQQRSQAEEVAEAKQQPETVELDEGNITEISALSVLESLAQVDENRTDRDQGDGNEGDHESRYDRRYKLVFVLERGLEENWWLRAALRYVRQDGSAGTLVNFTGARVTEPVESGERRLLGALIGAASPEEGAYEAPLAQVLAALRECPDTELYFADPAASGPPPRAQMNLFTAIEVTFVVEAFVPAPRFRPRLTVTTTDEERVQIDPEAEIVCGAGTVACITPYRNSVALSAPEASGAPEMAALLFREPSSYAYGDIARLRRAAERVAPAAARVQLPPPRIEFRKLTPTPMLYLDREQEATSVRLSFVYESDERGTGEEEIAEIGSTFASRYEAETLLVSRRNQRAEQKLHQRLHTVLSRLGQEAYRAAERSRPDEQAQQSAGARVRLGASLDTVLHDVAVPLLQEGWRVAVQRRRVRRMSQSLRFSVAGSGTDWFDLKPYVIDAEGQVQWLDLSDPAVQQGLIASERGYSLLTREDIELLNDLGDYPEGKKGAVRVKSFDLGVVASVQDRTDSDDSFDRVRTMVRSLQEAPEERELQLPPWFGGTLRSYQLAGTSWLDRLYQYGLSGCLADDMGLGKTIQALAFLSIRKAEGTLGSCLVVVPVSTIGNWQSEAERFAPELTAHVHAGPDRMRLLEQQKEADITIVSYETLLQDVETFSTQSFRFLIIDESQRIKNASTQSYRAVKQISADMRVALTGTPIENTTLELWSLMNLLLPGLLGSRARFIATYGAPIEKQQDPEASRRLRRKVGPFVLRRRKEDVAEQLPPREEVELVVEMSEQQRELYEKLREHYRSEVQASLQQSRATGSGEQLQHSQKILEGLLRLRQAALFPDLLDQSYEGYPSCKQEVLLEHIEPLVQEGHKALVFSQFVSVLSRLETSLSKAGIASVYLDGSTRNRQSVINRFQSDESVSVFLISLRAGGVGINLTAADYVYLFDPWWNPAVESQAIDRTHRIGQTRHVIAYRLIAKDSVEEKILHLQKRKRELSHSITPSDQDVIQSLSQEELAELFEP